ncbi:MAG: c-type cytochrome [Gammaproteobacteria bacterium]|jgi:cytochrome c5
MKIFNLALISGLSLTLASAVTIADHNTQESLEKRLSAVGTLNIMTNEEAAAAAAAAAEEAATAAQETQVASGPADGESVYNTSCTACHTPGIAGAPKLGDAAAWEARLAQGIEVLIEHAIQGYQGEAGVMPAKGGNPALSDDEVTAAVQYMLDNSG